MRKLCHTKIMMSKHKYWELLLDFAGDDLRRLESGVHVVSGTPGRVFDMIKRRALHTKNIKMLVLDEADEMLNKGFKEQIYDVYRYLPPELQARP